MVELISVGVMVLVGVLLSNFAPITKIYEEFGNAAKKAAVEFEKRGQRQRQ